MAVTMADITKLRIDRHQDIGKRICIIGALKQLLIHFIELF